VATINTDMMLGMQPWICARLVPLIYFSHLPHPLHQMKGLEPMQVNLPQGALHPTLKFVSLRETWGCWSWGPACLSRPVSHDWDRYSWPDLFWLWIRFQLLVMMQSHRIIGPAIPTFRQ